MQDNQKRQERAPERPTSGAKGTPAQANGATPLDRLERKRQRTGIKGELRRLCERYGDEAIPQKLIDLAHQLEEALMEQHHRPAPHGET